MGFVQVRHADGRTADITNDEVAFYRSIGFEPVEGAAVKTAAPGGKAAAANDQPPSAATGTEMRLDAILDELRGLRADMARAFPPGPEDEEPATIDGLFAPVVDELRGLRADLASIWAPVDVEPQEGETVELRGIGDPATTINTSTPDSLPDFSQMTRPEIDAYAAAHGVANPESYPNKVALIAAIEAAASDQD